MQMDCRSISKRIPRVEANQFQLIAANAVPAACHPNNVLMFWRACALAQSFFEVDHMASKPSGCIWHCQVAHFVTSAIFGVFTAARLQVRL